MLTSGAKFSMLYPLMVCKVHNINSCTLLAGLLPVSAFLAHLREYMYEVQYLLLRRDDVFAISAAVLCLLTVFFAFGVQTQRGPDGGVSLSRPSCKAA